MTGTETAPSIFLYTARLKIVLQVHRLLAKVEEMKAQRATLMEQFRAEVHEDDITKKLVTVHVTTLST